MEKVEFKPKLSTPVRYFQLVIIAITTAILAYPLVRALVLFVENPQEQTFLVIVFVTIFAILLSWVITGLIIYSQVMNRKLWIEKDLLYYSSKSLIGDWRTQTFHLEDIDVISDKIKTVVISTGRTLIPIQNYWFIIRFKDGHEEEVFMSGWDKTTMQEIISYLRKKFPHISFKTRMYKDSSEKLSGVDEFLEQHKHILAKK